MAHVRTIGLLWLGQSNQAGATLTDNGALGAKFVSEYMGTQEPFLPNANGGGSCLPKLLDEALEHNVRLKIINLACGGASVAHFTGSAGASVVGQVADPAIYSNMGGNGLSGGTGVPCVEGDANFDPFSLLARVRTWKAKHPEITTWIAAFANGESDGGMSSANYRTGLVSLANYLLSSGVDKVFIGLSASGGNSAANMNKLQAAYLAAIEELKAQGKPVEKGADLYAKWGMYPPLYTERNAVTTRVHLTLEGQRVNAELWNKAFIDGGIYS